jgi:hypothetical protein
MVVNYTDATDTNFKGEPYDIDTGKSLSAAGVRNALHTKENVSNKVAVLSSSSTDAQYPSAKVVYDALASLKEQVYAALQSVDILPMGTILAVSTSSWLNASATFKSNWKVCDGTGGTPNLRGRFLRGGTSTDAATGGADSTTLTENHIPAHTHGHGTLTAGGTDGLHTHTATSTFHWWDGSNTSTAHYVIDTDLYNDEMRTIHGVSNRVIDTVVNNTNSGHGHSISGNTDSYGKASTVITAVPTVPSYYTVIYIMKVT